MIKFVKDKIWMTGMFVMLFIMNIIDFFTKKQ